MRRFTGFAHLVQAKRLALPGAYMTDERRLFRVLARRTIGEETLIELEDCATLDVWQLTLKQVARLRPVRAAECDRGGEALLIR
jgi:hypothetical protein